MARIIFYQRDGAKELDRWMESYLGEEDIVFERDRHFCKGNRKTYEDYLSEEDCYEIDAAALRLAEGWYKDRVGKDHTICDDISLGKMVEYKLMKYLVRVLKDIALLLKIKEKERPSAFIFIDDSSILSELLKEFSSGYGIKTETLPFSPEPVSPPPRTSWLRDSPKTMVWYILALFQRLARKKKEYKQTVAIEAYGKFIPLIKKLVQGGYKIIILGRLGLEKDLFKPNIFYRHWPDLNKIKVKAANLKVAEDILSNIPPDLWVFRSFNCGGLILKKLREVINSDFLALREAILKTTAFLSCHEVKTIITLQDRDGLNRLLVACGNSRGLKTIEIQHGTLANLPYLVSPISQKLCVWGRAGKEFYLKRKIEKKRIHIVGDFYLEGLKKSSPERTVNLKKALGLNLSKPTILFASQPFIEISSLDSPLKTLDIFEAVVELSQEVREAEFLVKFHPSEKADIKRKILKERGYKNILIAEKGLVSELLSISQVLITFCSSIVIEAAILGVPIITLNLTARKDFLPIVEMGAALAAYRKEELVPQIKSVLYDEKTRQTLAEGRKRFINFQIDPSSSLGRIMELI